MKNTLSKRLGLAGIVLGASLGLANIGCVPEENNHKLTRLESLHNNNSIKKDKVNDLVPIEKIPPYDVNNSTDSTSIPQDDGWVSTSENLDQKLIGYNIPKGSYVIIDQGKDSCKIFGYVDLENQENLLKGQSYERGKESSIKFDRNGKIRYTLPPGKYKILSVNEFESTNPIEVVELGYQTSAEKKEQSGKAYSSTLIITEEHPEGDVIKAVQPEPYESIEHALKRPDVEEYFLPREKGKIEYKARFKEQVLPNPNNIEYKSRFKEQVLPQERDYR